jgi:hypothetical protein
MRFADDDIIVCFEHRRDADRYLHHLREAGRILATPSRREELGW